ncbi:MAG: PepSY domain-containing protein [Methanobacteriaceae archaeon]|nr:PepSY domain-containing protein [Methanobacteriaceae archaeon]MDP2836130.1 PepSY domain-containing protein [Methanobacteriaceae archaeon]MDP3034204.1 PepSY domain-containing protein [Methanobacteriaceae archaeon]MDP3485970.1 PepSY domain-containing protein [Methanobacteriaceae archaeon]MDP3624332.1 PepSY domain-containing protein [Methanobacteriaceae archaeon]
MINSKILVSMVIVLMVGVAAAGYQISQTPQLWQLTTPQSSDSSSQGDSQSSSSPSDVVQSQSGSGSSSSGSSQGSTSGGSSVKISSEEAKNIVLKNYVGEKGITVKSVKLTTGSDGKKKYIVVLQDQSGKAVGEIEIDANTGANLGGAGGAP